MYELVNQELPGSFTNHFSGNINLNEKTTPQPGIEQTNRDTQWYRDP